MKNISTYLSEGFYSTINSKVKHTIDLCKSLSPLIKVSKKLHNNRIALLKSFQPGTGFKLHGIISGYYVYCIHAYDDIWRYIMIREEEDKPITASDIFNASQNAVRPGYIDLFLNKMHVKMGCVLMVDDDKIVEIKL